MMAFLRYISLSWTTNPKNPESKGPAPLLPEALALIPPASHLLGTGHEALWEVETWHLRAGITHSKDILVSLAPAPPIPGCLVDDTCLLRVYSCSLAGIFSCRVLWNVQGRNDDQWQ